jgi:plastocyanin
MARRAALVGLAAALGVAACGAGAQPTWTYVPVPSQPPIAASSPTPSRPPAPTEPPGSRGGATVLDLTAKNIAYDKKALSAPAGTAFTIHFDNEDSGVAHDVAILEGSTAGRQVFSGDVITGVKAIDYGVQPLPAGDYTIICTVHPTLMIATLTVK